MQSSCSSSYAHLEGKTVRTIPMYNLIGSKKTEVATGNSLSLLVLIILECRFWKYGIYKNNIDDQPTSTFQDIYETIIIKKFTESTTCMLNMGSLHPYRRNSQNAIILVKLWCSVTLFQQSFWAFCCVRHYSTRFVFPGHTLVPRKCITELTFLKYSIFWSTVCFLVPPFLGFPFPGNWNKYRETKFH